MPESPSVQRSFRLSTRTLELLDAAAEEAGTSRNALADRLLGEAVRLERHPLIRFQPGAAGRRQPLLAGTRLYVHQVISTLRAEGGDPDAAADYLAISSAAVQAAVSYYADFQEEVDEDAEVAARVAAQELTRWERQRRVVS